MSTLLLWIRRSFSWAMAVVSLAAVGCGYAERVLDGAHSVVDPRRAFPEYAPDAESWQFSPCEGWADPAAKRYAMGSLFTAELPPAGGWSWVRTEDASLWVYKPSHSSVPSAALLVEEMGLLTQAESGAALRAFQGRVDQRLSSPLARLPWTFRDLPKAAEGPEGYPGSPDSASAGASPGPAPASTSSPAATIDPSLSKAQAGAGVDDSQSTDRASDLARNAPAALAAGYSSKRDSFTGWRWIGRCDSSESGSADSERRPLLRISRSRGTWRLPAAAAPVSAFALMGTVTLPNRVDQGAYWVLICTEEPTCEVAPVLARMLGSLRLASAAPATGNTKNWESGTPAEVGSWEDLLASVGIAK
jgi:hypothetical protein